MIRQLLLASALTLGSTCTLMSATNAQTSDPYTNQLLRQGNSIAAEAYRYARDVAEPEANRYQAYLQQLYSACFNYGDGAACNEYQQRMQNQMRHQERLQRQWESYYNQDWVDSFGY